MKSISTILKPTAPHWVGNGFPVRSLFSYDRLAEVFSPFLLLDYASPMKFPPDGVKRGVGVHPHRGFETVTIVYQGELAHRDSTGNGGTIGQDEVQWMTAGSGILHEEFHSKGFGHTGGTLQMVQLWVNLPKKDKRTPPAYQAIARSDIPTVVLPDNAGILRPIAGEYETTTGPAKTFTPMNVWDIRLNADGRCRLEVPEGWTCAVVVLSGEISVNGSEPVKEAEIAVLSKEKSTLNIIASQPSLILLLSGTPIEEPIVGYGPFVLNEEAEIIQAYEDLKLGRFGQL